MSAVLREIERCGATVFLKDGKPYIREGTEKVAESILERARAHREEIILALQRDDKARSTGFLTLVSGEVYERQISPITHVFLQAEAGQWIAWRETWKTGMQKSINVKKIASGTAFETALMKAKSYINSTSGKRK